MRKRSEQELKAAQAELLKYYNSDKNYRKKLVRKQPAEYLAVLKALEICGTKQMRILDVGCGIGRLLEVLRSHGYRNIEGVDACQSYAKQAKRIQGVIVHAGDFLHVRLDGPYDCIVSTDLLEHAVHPELIVQRMGKLLSRDGILILQGPNMIGLVSRKTGIQSANVKIFLSKLFRHWFSVDQRIYYLIPRLDEQSYQIDDLDAIYLLNPFDLFFLVRKNGFRVLLFSSFYNPVNRYSHFSRAIVLFLTRMPVLRYAGGSLLVVAAKGRVAEGASGLRQAVEHLY